MNTPSSPASPASSLVITRSDVVLWFLRLLLWVALVQVVASQINFLGFPHTRSDWMWNVRHLLTSLVPVLILAVFPGLLAANSLGQTARDPIASLSDARFLLKRCLGLWLVIQCLGQLLDFTLYRTYECLTTPGTHFWGAPLFSQLFWVQVGYVSSFFLPFLLGLFLAFGPTIRDNFRAR